MCKYRFGVHIPRLVQRYIRRYEIFDILLWCGVFSWLYVLDHLNEWDLIVDLVLFWHFPSFCSTMPIKNLCALSLPQVVLPWFWMALPFRWGLFQWVQGFVSLCRVALVMDVLIIWLPQLYFEAAVNLEVYAMAYIFLVFPFCGLALMNVSNLSNFSYFSFVQTVQSRRCVFLAPFCCIISVVEWGSRWSITSFTVIT